MRTVKIEIKGISPVMFDKMYEDVRPAGSTGPKGNKDLSPREEAEPRLHLNDKGQICAPSEWIMNSMINAGRHIKLGKRQLSTTRDSQIPGFVTMLSGVYIPMLNPNTKKILTNKHCDWEVDGRSIVTNGGRQMKYRPRVDEWTIGFEIEYDPSELSEAVIRELVDRSGRNVGIGSFRPQKRGPYGKFNVTSWKISEKRTSDVCVAV